METLRQMVAAEVGVTLAEGGHDVDVACRDGDSAIRAMRRLAPCLPALLAIGANSPFWHGVDTGYRCFRQRLLASNPTYGLPPYFASWSDFNSMVDAGIRSRTIESFRDLQGEVLNRISHFFEHYKDLDEGKWVRVDGWYGIDEAKQEIMDSVQMYKDAPEKPNF